MKRNPTLLTLAFAVLLGQGAAAQEIVVADGAVHRTLDTTDGHVRSASYTLAGNNGSFANKGSREFSFLLNDRLYTGQDVWQQITLRDTTSACGMTGTIVSFQDTTATFRVHLTYLTYPSLPLVRKYIAIENLSTADLKLEGVKVEDFVPGFSCTESYTLRQYARYKALGPYVGNWDDPLVVVYDQDRWSGMAIGNEAVGVVKRTAVFEDGRSVSAGVTQPSQDIPFRRWLAPGQCWRSAAVFTAPFSGTDDASRVVNTTVQTYVHKYMGVRVEQIPHKPMFVYNTWVPFYQNINADLICEVADAAAECGVEEFVIDDGWQTNFTNPAQMKKDVIAADWDVNTERFPDGLRPVFDHIKSLGMKPGLWLSLARLNRTNRSAVDHPEWFIVGRDGSLSDLHTSGSAFYTACMGTDWCDYIRNTILHYVRDYGLMYAKLDLAIVTSAYTYDPTNTGCYATNHPWHRDREESFDVIYERCMALFDELHREAPDLFIDCTFETAGKLQLMDYGIAQHAEGNWLSNVHQPGAYGAMRVRNLAWGRTPALPPTSLVIGNLRLDDAAHLLAYKSLTGTLPIMLGDPRKLTSDERTEMREWSQWLRGLEERHGIMSFRQNLPDFGEPQEGAWDAFARLNTDTRSGGLVGVFRQGAATDTRTITIPWLDDNRLYVVRQGVAAGIVFQGPGKELRQQGFTVHLHDAYDGELYEVAEYK